MFVVVIRNERLSNFFLVQNQAKPAPIRATYATETSSQPKYQTRCSCNVYLLWLVVFGNIYNSFFVNDGFVVIRCILYPISPAWFPPRVSPFLSFPTC